MFEAEVMISMFLAVWLDAGPCGQDRHEVGLFGLELRQPGGRHQPIVFETACSARDKNGVGVCCLGARSVASSGSQSAWPACSYVYDPGFTIFTLL